MQLRFNPLTPLAICFLLLLSCKPKEPKKVPVYMFGIAQGTFRTNDPDGDGKNDYWRGDIAGLYAIRSPQGKAIALIPLEAALADSRPSADLSGYGEKAPWCGYWFRAIRNEDEKGVLAPDRFAICCYPDQYTPGKWTFIINELGVVFSKDLGHAGGVEVFPAMPLNDGWSRVE